MLPTNLPNVSTAKLPAVYEEAKHALTTCSQIDECAKWANKAEALASYAKQSEDDTLRKMADRIQARAIRRCGELLAEIKPAKNQHDAGKRASGGAPTSRSQAAKDAGLSRDQKVQALRVAKIPEPEFESAVESPKPPTVTELAERGKQAKPLVNLEGRHPSDFKAATEGHGCISRLADCAARLSPELIVRGTLTNERARVQEQVTACLRWLSHLQRELEA